MGTRFSVTASATQALRRRVADGGNQGLGVAVARVGEPVVVGVAEGLSGLAGPAGTRLGAALGLGDGLGAAAGVDRGGGALVGTGAPRGSKVRTSVPSAWPPL